MCLEPVDGGERRLASALVFVTESIFTAKLRTFLPGPSARLIFLFYFYFRMK